MAENSEIENDQKDDSEEDEVEVDEQRDDLNNDQNVNSDNDEVELDEQRDVIENDQNVHRANESFLLENEDLEKHKVEVIAGDKEGSEWIVIDDIYILHKYRTSGKEIFWECSGRRAFDCPFKAATTQKDEGDDNPELELVFMYKLDTHDCGQTKLGPIMQKFRNQIKSKVSKNFKNKFHNVFAEEKKLLLNQYRNSPELLERIIYELKDKRSYRVAAQRARAKKFPRNPTCASEMNLDLIGLKRFQLGSSSHFDPEVTGKEIILLGTPLTAKAWAQSEFKSGDGTFKICPKQFYQVFVLMALFGGVYVTCMIGLLPDKTKETYERFFAMVSAYLEANDLPNNFEGHFFMTDFEKNIRNSFHLFWPSVRTLGCYFHFSQLVWKRVKKSGFQTAYEMDDKFNAVVRRISALPFIKPCDLEEAFIKFNERAESLEDEEVKKFTLGLIDYAQVQWRERFAVQDWNLYDLNCLLVPSTNNGNEGANGRFLTDFGVHPSFWSFIIDATTELERAENDIPSILYSSLIPRYSTLYTTLKEDRERVKANYEAGLIDLDGMMGKMGAISLATGKAKFATDDEESQGIETRSRKKNDANRVEKDQGKKRRGRPPKKTGISAGGHQEVSLHEPAQEPQVLDCQGGNAAAQMIGCGNNVQIANISRDVTGLVIPARIGLQPIPAALPSSKARTTSSAVPNLITAERSLCPINISSSFVSRNALVDHISKFQLGLRERPPVPADGNCWYWSNVDLVKKFQLDAPRDPHVLRKAVTNSLENHRHKKHWVKNYFQGKVRKYNKFIKEHSQPGTFTDNFGIIVLATGDYLDVKYHLIGTSNNAQNPFTILGEENSKHVFHVGLFQDTTDVHDGPRTAGHYQSLEMVPDEAVPCCNIIAVNTPLEIDVTIQNTDVQEFLRKEAKEKIEMEENILKVFKHDKEMVLLSLKRVLHIPNVDTEVLFETDITNILYTEMRQIFKKETIQGKLCRQILKKYQQLCLVDPRLRNEELPPISDVSDDEVFQEPVRDFGAIFTGVRRSVLCSEQNRLISTVHDETPEPDHLASSTIVESVAASIPSIGSFSALPISPPIPTLQPAASVQPRRKPGRPRKNLTLTSSVSVELTPQPRRKRGRRGRSATPSPQRSQVRTSPSIVLTPPPATPSPPAKRRGRPPKKTTAPPALISPPRKKRGRPFKRPGC